MFKGDCNTCRAHCNCANEEMILSNCPYWEWRQFTALISTLKKKILCLLNYYCFFSVLGQLQMIHQSVVQKKAFCDPKEFFPHAVVEGTEAMKIDSIPCAGCGGKMKQ